MRSLKWRLPSLHSFLWLFPLLLFATAIFGGQALVWGTPSLQFIPWRSLAWNQIQQGIWPFWNPYNGMGAPLLANYQLALYYPPSWPLYALQAVGGTPWLAWGHTLVLVAHLAWAGYGASRLVRQLGLGELARVIAGLAFSMGAYLVARAGFFNMVWSAAWLPWIVLSVEQIAAETGLHRQLRPLGLMALFTGMQFLSGHAQITWYSLLFAGCWAVVAGWTRGGWRGLFRTTGLAVIAVLVGACIAAVQLIPTYELLQQSQRASAVDFDFAMTYSFWPWRILTMITPSFFGNPAYGDYWGYASYWEDAVYLGLLPFLAAVSTFGLLRRRHDQQASDQLQNARIWLLWFMAIFGFLFGLGNNTPVFPFLYQNIPTFDMFQAPARYMLWPVFSMSILAAIGVNHWKKPTGQSLRQLRRLPLLIIAGLAGVGFAYFAIPGIKASFIYSLLIVGILGLIICGLRLWQPREDSNNGKARWSFMVVVFVGVDLLVAGWGQNPTTSMSFYAETKDEENAESVSMGRLFLDEQSEYELKFDRFLRFEDYRPLENWANMRDLNLPNLNILNRIPSTNNFDPLRPVRYNEWMDYLATLSPENREPWLIRMGVDQVEQVTPAGGQSVVMTPVKGSQRLKFYPCAIRASDEKAAWEITRSIIEQNLDQIVVENNSLFSPECNLKYNDKISILSEQATRIEIAVNNTSDGWLYMADTWYPGWQASVDGAVVEITRANYVFRAVPIRAGRHTIIFEYHPKWLLPAMLVTSLGVFVMGILLLFGQKLHHR